jgi:hypothetical protein
VAYLFLVRTAGWRPCEPRRGSRILVLKAERFFCDHELRGSRIAGGFSHLRLRRPRSAATVCIRGDRRQRGRLGSVPPSTPQSWQARGNRLRGKERSVRSARSVSRGRPPLLARLGFVPRDGVPRIARRLRDQAVVVLEDGTQLAKLLVARRESNGPFLIRNLTEVERFLRERVEKYPRQKYADRMFFGPVLFQTIIELTAGDRRQ